MSEIAAKMQKRRLVDAVIDHFKTMKFRCYKLDGNPFDLEFCRKKETWKIRCVIGEIFPLDKTLIEKEELNEHFTKAIAHRLDDGKKGFDLIEIN